MKYSTVMVYLDTFEKLKDARAKTQRPISKIIKELVDKHEVEIIFKEDDNNG